MNQPITLESLAQRVEALERTVGVPPLPTDDSWLRAVGMFAGSEFM